MPTVKTNNFEKLFTPKYVAELRKKYGLMGYRVDNTFERFDTVWIECGNGDEVFSTQRIVEDSTSEGFTCFVLTKDANTNITTQSVTTGSTLKTALNNAITFKPEG